MSLYFRIRSAASSLLGLFINVYWFRLAQRQSATENRCQSALQPFAEDQTQIFRQKIMNFLHIFSPHNAEENCAPFFGTENRRKRLRLKGKNWGSLSRITRDLPRLSSKVNSRGVATPWPRLPKGECTPIMRNFLR